MREMAVEAGTGGGKEVGGERATNDAQEGEVGENETESEGEVRGVEDEVVVEAEEVERVPRRGEELSNEEEGRRRPIG